MPGELARAAGWSDRKRIRLVNVRRKPRLDGGVETMPGRGG
jgi:hypothetical protein